MKRDRSPQGRPDPANREVGKKNHRSAPETERKRPAIVYEQIPIGIVERSLQGRYINANEEFCQIVGYEKGELLTIGIKEVTYDDDYPIDIRLHQQLVEGKIPSYRLEKRYVRKDGTIAWVELTSSLVRNAEGKSLYTVGAVLDITERKRAEEKYRRIVETANEGIWEVDRDMRTVFVNSRMADMLGYTVEEMKGRSVFEFLFPEDYAEGERRLEQARQGSSTRSNEFRYRRKDGSALWTLASRTPAIDDQGNFLGAFAMFSDITELKNAEQALQELNLELEQRVHEQTAELQAANRVLLEQIEERKRAEELLRSWAHVFEHADWGIATVFQDRFVMMNPRYAAMHGYTVEELIGRTIYDVLTPESHADTRQQVRLAYEKGHHLYENIHVRKDGSTFPALVDTSVVRDSEGNVLYRAVSVQDITERKQAEEDLKRSRQYLQALSRRLVELQEEERRSIARELHDRVGQNLSALALNLMMIQNQPVQGSMPDRAARLTDSIHLVEETNRLVRDLLTELRPAVLDDYGLKAALQAYIDEFAPRYNIEVAFEAVNEPFPRLHPGLEITLLRIAQEALTNVGQHAQAGQASLSLRLQNDIVYLAVSDNGIGMQASQDQPHRVSHGLKIMRERAEAFGGTVMIETAPEAGTRVEAVIPAEGPGQTG